MSNTTKTPISAKDLDKVVGGSGDSYRQGTEKADYIETGAGNDAVFAGGGNDEVTTGAGNDYVEGGAGNDFINLGAGNDVAIGGDGKDVILTGAGADYVEGGAGNDTIVGNDGDRTTDVAFGGTGDDLYIWSPGSGNDQFHGEAGKDTLGLSGVSMSQLQSGVQSYDSGLTIQPSNDGKSMSFVNSAGQPQPFSGQVTIGGETVQFFNIERIAVG